MNTNRFRLLGIVVVFAAFGLAAWKLWPGMHGDNEKFTTEAHPIPARAEECEVAASETKSFDTPFTLELLSQEHERTPSAEEWAELSRILLYAPDGDMVESVKARFAVHAGTRELAVLADAYDSPLNDGTRQRILEVFGSLQSGSFMEAARQILTNESLPITDHLVNACAISLARRGEQMDVEVIFKRLNSAGEDPEPEGSLYSDTDGLVGAIRNLQNPALESFLCDAAAGRGVATTGRTRAAAASALRSYHTVPVTAVLYDLSKNASDPLVRQRAKESLKVIQTPE